MAVVGQVGSGKSSLISALLGEMELMDGQVNVRVSPVSALANVLSHPLCVRFLAGILLSCRGIADCLFWIRSHQRLCLLCA